MDPNPDFWAGKRVCVTGGTGFLGWHLTQQLLALTPHVRILGLQPASSHLAAKLKPLDCVFGDIRDPVAVRAALCHCDVVFHTAGTVAVWGPALTQMHEIHSLGTQQVLHALPAHARLIHTSSVVAIGAMRRPETLTESSPFGLERLKVDYVHAKKAAEDLALNAAAQGKDVVVVNPAYLIGPTDHEGSIMGRFCLRFWKGKVKAIPPGGMNFVDVRDVACGHLLAAERGRTGQRYILGGENMTMRQFTERLIEARGMPAHWRLRMPHWLLTTIALLGECRAAVLRREPKVAMQYARLSRYFWYYSSRRAESELGYRARPVEDSLADAHQWWCEHGRLKPSDAVLRAASDRAA